MRSSIQNTSSRRSASLMKPEFPNIFLHELASIELSDRACYWASGHPYTLIVVLLNMMKITMLVWKCTPMYWRGSVV